MISDLREWLKLRIAKHRETLEKLYEEYDIDKTKLMSENGFNTLPPEVLKEVFCLDTLVQTATFLDQDTTLNPVETMSPDELAVEIYTAFGKELYTWSKEHGVPYFTMKEWLTLKIGEGYGIPSKNDIMESIQKSILMWAVIKTNSNENS